MENTTVYVANLPYSAKTEDVRSHFEELGEIRKCVLIQKKGIAFVEFAQRSDAQRALDEKQGSDLGGRPVRLDWAKPRTDKPRREGSSDFHSRGPRREGRGEYGDRREGRGHRGDRHEGRRNSRGDDGDRYEGRPRRERA